MRAVELLRQKKTLSEVAQDREVFRILGESLERCPRPGGRRGLEGQAASRSDAAVDGPAERTPAENAAGRRKESRLCDRVVDLPTGGGGDPTAVWGDLPRRLCGNPAAQAGLEPTKARAAGARPTKRQSPVPRSLAADKKRGSSKKLAWYFSTNRASCCNPCAPYVGSAGPDADPLRLGST